MAVVRRTSAGEVVELSSERVTKACVHQMRMAAVPEWRNDPSYFWNRKAK